MSWKEIYTHLVDSEYDTYPIGGHKGECRAPYIVLRDNGAVLRQSLTGREYELLLYYPIGRYVEFADYISSVKRTMNALFPRLRLADDEQPHYLDDDVKAYMTSLIYVCYQQHNINRLERIDLNGN